MEGGESVCQFCDLLGGSSKLDSGISPCFQNCDHAVSEPVLCDEYKAKCCAMSGLGVMDAFFEHWLNRARP